MEGQVQSQMTIRSDGGTQAGTRNLIKVQNLCLFFFSYGTARFSNGNEVEKDMYISFKIIKA